MGRSKTGIKSNIKHLDLVSIDELNSKDILSLFRIASEFSKKTPQNLLSGKIVALLFFEPSTRTFSSFSSAVKRLGGQTIEYQNPAQTSSLIKGETFEDMIKVYDPYADAIVIRHSETGSAKRAADISTRPVINAGDGAGQHPTQSLLDLYTIYSHHRITEGLKGLIVGDLINGRTVHSLIKILSKFKSNQVYLLSVKELSLSETQLNEFEKEGIKIHQIQNIDQIPKDLDFWYWTRIQKERLGNKNFKNEFILSNNLIKKYAGKNTIFMHPLPRVGEILEEVDRDPRAVYLTEQIQNGVYIRMAILSWILAK